jgi:hypothetical protein
LYASSGANWQTHSARSEELFKDMSVKAVFKGVTYESLNDPDFMRIASQRSRLWTRFMMSSMRRKRQDREIKVALKSADGA